MNGPVVVGFDGSPESLAATRWAADEARVRGLPLELLQAWPWPKLDVVGSNEVYVRSREQLVALESDLRVDHRDLQVSAVHLPADPAEALAVAGRNATLLVLGSRGLGTVHGFLVGSVSQEVLRRATCPVLLVRASGGGTGGPVLVGFDLGRPADEVLAFAFWAAAARTAPLRVVHVWEPPAAIKYLSYDATGHAGKDLAPEERARLDGALEPWRARHPEVDVTADLVHGNTAVELTAAAQTARLLVLGRRIRQMPLGAHLGPVAHAAIHHVDCPVAIVPHG
ncbi:universal stress protein [Kitasatospora sp. NPDC101176]|uniref:universal stress protein n=1 Tax=Kitasatospora sp. NPDC101176 TaxID=3364099 RepID=UPI0038156606